MKCNTACNSAIPYLCMCPGERKACIHTKSWHVCVHSRRMITVVRREKQSICPSTNEWINKMMYAYSGILFSNKKYSTNVFYNMNEGWKYFTKWKVNHKRLHITWLYLYEMCLVCESLDPDGSTASTPFRFKLTLTDTLNKWVHEFNI